MKKFLQFVGVCLFLLVLHDLVAVALLQDHMNHCLGAYRGTQLEKLIKDNPNISQNTLDSLNADIIMYGDAYCRAPLFYGSK
jgi:hypothetical protein